MNRKTEKGQVLVIIALAMIAILGITALAIDGSLDNFPSGLPTGSSNRCLA